MSARWQVTVIGGLCVWLVSNGAAVQAEPRGLKAVSHPETNPSSEAKIALGHQLYFEPRLSRDNTISCASCHDPAKGYSNGEQFATGVRGQKGGRNSPTVLNSAYQKFQFWDGREGSLEGQALGPIQNPIEMDLTLPEAVERLSAIKGYREQFKEVFGTEVTAETIGLAIAAYERTVVAGDSPYDRWLEGDKSALSETAERGRKLFFGKANCSACHAGENFTDNAFHNIGIGMDQPEPDKGRAAISGLGGDTGAFKTPTLRDLPRTAPYMHDGSLATLEAVIEHYNKGGIANPYLDEEIFAMQLTPEEQADLLVFLREGLASGDYPAHKPPTLPE